MVLEAHPKAARNRIADERFGIALLITRFPLLVAAPGQRADERIDDAAAPRQAKADQRGAVAQRDEMIVRQRDQAGEAAEPVVLAAEHPRAQKAQPPELGARGMFGIEHHRADGDRLIVVGPVLPLPAQRKDAETDQQRDHQQRPSPFKCQFVNVQTLLAEREIKEAFSAHSKRLVHNKLVDGAKVFRF